MKSNTYIYKKCEKKVHVFAQQIFHLVCEIQMNIQKKIKKCALVYVQSALV